MIYLTLPELVYIAERATGGEVAIRDVGLLGAAAARPRAAAFGADAYAALDQKVTALLHSLARNRALTDGNKRLALGAVIAFYGVNGQRLNLTNDAACDLIIQVATGELDSAGEIAAILVKSTERRS